MGSITFGRQNLITAKLDTAAVFAQKKRPHSACEKQHNVETRNQVSFSGRKHEDLKQHVPPGVSIQSPVN